MASVKPDAQSIKDLFRSADGNNDGFISRAELEHVFRSYGEWTDEEFDTLFSTADATKDGMLSYDEFVDWVMDADVEGKGPQKLISPPLPNVLAGKQTTVVTFNRALDLVFQGCLSEKVEQVVAVIDSVQACLSAYFLFSKELKEQLKKRTGIGMGTEDLDLTGINKVVFLLTPSTTSAEEYLTCQEYGACAVLLLTASFSNWDVRYIRRDEWFTLPTEYIMSTMLERGKKLFPKEEAQNMHDYIYTQFMNKLCLRIPWRELVFRKIRGAEEGELGAAAEILESNGLHSLDALEAVEYGGERGGARPVMLFQEQQKRTYIGFGEAAGKFAEQLGLHIHRVDDWQLTGDTTHDYSSLWKDDGNDKPGIEECKAKFKSMLSDRETLYLAEKQAWEEALAAAEEEDDDDIYDEVDKFFTIPYDERASIDKGLEAKAAQCHTFNGVPVCEALDGYIMGESHIVMFVAPSDLLLRQPSSGDFLVMNFMRQAYEIAPDATSLVVLVNDSFESFGQEYGPYMIDYCIEYASLSLFVTWDELPGLSDLLSCPGDVCRALLVSQVSEAPHFLTLNSALGQTLEGDEIIFPEVAFGCDVEPLAQSFFAVSQKCNFFFYRPDGTPITKNILCECPGRGGSVIAPSKLLTRLLSNTLIDDCADYFSKHEAELKGTTIDAQGIEQNIDCVRRVISDYERCRGWEEDSVDDSSDEDED